MAGRPPPLACGRVLCATVRRQRLRNLKTYKTILVRTHAGPTNARAVFRTSHDAYYPNASIKLLAPLQSGLVRHYSMTAEQMQRTREKARDLQIGHAPGYNWANASCGKPLYKKLPQKLVEGCADYYKLLSYMESQERYSKRINSMRNETLRESLGTTSPYFCPQNRLCPGPKCRPWTLYNSEQRIRLPQLHPSESKR